MIFRSNSMGEVYLISPSTHVQGVMVKVFGQNQDGGFEFQRSFCIRHTMYYFEVPCASDEDQLEATPVKCITSDNQEIFVEIGILRVSKMLNDLLGVRPDPEEVEIPLSEVKAQTFNMVIEWCKNHKGAPDPIIKHDPVTRQREWITMTEWEEAFFRRYLPHLWDLAMAANYLNISSLYYCTCQKIAEQIKGKSPEQIREMFGIEDDLTDKEKRQIRRRNMRNMLAGYR